MKAKLIRFTQQGGGMAGRFVLFSDGGTEVFHMFTLERQWANNQPNVSCIPEGQYDVYPYQSPTFGRTLVLEGIGVSVQKAPNVRWGILIHPANHAHELQGCIAPAHSLTIKRGEIVANPPSSSALAALLDKVGSNPFKLIITREHW